MPILARHRHEEFAQRVASGDSGASAYRTIYRAKGASADTAASRLLSRVEVSSRVAELRKQAAGAGAVEEAKTAAKAAGRVVLAITKKRQLLYAFATARNLKPADRMRAIELDAKLAGEIKGDSVTVHATAVSGIVLSEQERLELMVRKRAAAERARITVANGN